MGSEDEASRLLSPEERVSEIWRQIFVKELAVASVLYPYSTSATYENVFAPESVSIITRSFRDEPFDLAHTIIVRAYQRGRLMKYASAVNTVDHEGIITPHVNYQAVRGEIPSSAELLGQASLNTLVKLESGFRGE